MSFYSGGEIKTRILDPVNDISNVRSEFRLDDLGAVMSNMKLLDVGCRVDSASTSYNTLTGAYGVIKNIRLMDNNTELSSCRDANLFLGFKNLQNSNSQNESLGKYVSRGELGFYTDSSSGEQAESRILVASVETTEEITSKGHLELRQILPILNSVRSFDNLRFKKLRLVVEYESNPAKVCESKANPIHTTRPSLCVDVIEDEGVRNSELENTPESVNWVEIEKDSFIIPAVSNLSGTNTTQSQSSNNKVNGFNNKTLGRILMMKQRSNINSSFNGNDVVGFGNNGSKGLYEQKTQYRVNGRNILSGSGVEGNNSRMALLCDTWGDINQVLAGNILGSNCSAFTNDGVNREGETDYEGIFIGEMVRNLEILIDRVGVFDTGGFFQDADELIVNVYGEVNKNIQMKGDEYLISYN